MDFDRAKDSTPPAASRAKSARGKAAREAGYAAEDAVSTWLAGQGVTIVERNVRFRGGEVDLVVDDGGTLAFVEVRLRSSARFGGAAASVGAVKQQRIALAAQLYLQRRPRLAERPCRFDCALMDGEGRIEWLKDAFRL